MTLSFAVAGVGLLRPDAGVGDVRPELAGVALVDSPVFSMACWVRAPYFYSLRVVLPSLSDAACSVSLCVCHRLNPRSLIPYQIGNCRLVLQIIFIRGEERLRHQAYWILQFVVPWGFP